MRMEKKRRTGRNTYEIIWGCREIDNAVNEIYCFSPTFTYKLMKGIIINFGVQKKAWRCREKPLN